MGRAEHLREQALAFTYEADAILRAADAAGRDCTADEADRIRIATGQAERYIIQSNAAFAAGDCSSRQPGSLGGLRDMSGQAVPFQGPAAWPAPRASRPSVHGGASWGEAVVDAINRGGRFSAAALTGGSLAVSVPLNPVPVTLGRRTDFLRQLIPGSDAPNGQYSYMKQTVRTNNAAVVAPGAVKPKSIYTLARVNDYTRTIAHMSEPLNRNDLADASLLQAFIDGELRYGLDLAIDVQILNGAGTAEMTGITLESGIQLQAFATDIITTIRKSITKLEVSDLSADGIAMNPADWEKVELAAMAAYAAKDGMPTPVDSMRRSLFGVPVVSTNAMTAGSAIVGAWATSSEFYTTQDATIDWSEDSDDPDALGAGVGAGDFERNLVRFRAEGRWNVAWTRPAGFVLATLA
jgi:HK97 family phage major capsid protein